MFHCCLFILAEGIGRAVVVIYKVLNVLQPSLDLKEFNFGFRPQTLCVLKTFVDDIRLCLKFEYRNLRKMSALFYLNFTVTAVDSIIASVRSD